MERIKRQLVKAVHEHLRKQKRAQVPEAGRLVWGIFSDLSNARTIGPAGPNPIQYSEIEAYMRLHCWPLEPRHVDLVRAMDEAWMEAVVAKSLDKQPISDVTPQALDAVLGMF